VVGVVRSSYNVMLHECLRYPRGIHYTTRIVKAVERELEKVFNQASLYRRSADTLWSSARIGDVGKTKRGYMCLLPLTAKEENVIAMISGGRTPFLLRSRKEGLRTRRFFKMKRKKVE
jgi:hypothetical protein